MKTLWPYVEDEVLLREIRLVLSEFQEKMESVNIYKNVVDPFSGIFDMAKQKIDFEEWIVQEQSRQSQKTLQNLVGYFHQHILGQVDGWIDPGQGGSVDLISDKHKVIVELKNKHNTLNSGGLSQTYRKMASHLDGEKRGYQGYVVYVIPKRPVRVSKHFAPNDEGIKVTQRDDLMEIDGASIYEIVTGDKHALKKLFTCLPEAIDRAIPGTDLDNNQNRKDKFTELFTRAYGL